MEILLRSAAIFLNLVGLITLPIFSLYAKFFKKCERPPKIENKVLTMSATELADKIRTQEAEALSVACTTSVTHIEKHIVVIVILLLEKYAPITKIPLQRENSNSKKSEKSVTCTKHRRASGMVRIFRAVNYTSATSDSKGVLLMG